jgi:hypothetical protein
VQAAVTKQAGKGAKPANTAAPISTSNATP